MFGWPMQEEAKLEFTITVNWRREDGSIATTQLGRWTAALAARPKMWVCNSRMSSQFSDGIDQDGPAPSDPRDDVYLNGALRLETRAAISGQPRLSHNGSTPFARAPFPGVELRAFMSPYLST